MRISIVVLIISVSSAYKLKHIEGLDKKINLVEFDYNGNIYAVTGNNLKNVQIHKFNSSKVLISTIEAPNNTVLVYDILVNKQNDVYFEFYGQGNLTFSILKSNSKNIEDIDNSLYSFPNVVYQDEDNNVIFNTLQGVQLVRPGLTEKIPIANVENLYIKSRGAMTTDKDGNIYFHVQGMYFNNSIAVLTKKALNEEIPHATFLDVPETDTRNKTVSNLLFDENNDLWILIKDFAASKFIIKKVSKDGVKTVSQTATQYLNYTHFQLINGKNKIYVIYENYFSLTKIFYITNDNEMMEIPELNGFGGMYGFTKGLNDSDGAVYFITMSQFSAALGPLIVIQANETHPRALLQGNSGILLQDLKMDFNNDLWISSTEGIYYLRKNESKLELVEPLPGFDYYSYHLVVNFKQNEIYVQGADGLYYVD